MESIYSMESIYVMESIYYVENPFTVWNFSGNFLKNWKIYSKSWLEIYTKIAYNLRQETTILNL